MVFTHVCFVVRSLILVSFERYLGALGSEACAQTESIRPESAFVSRRRLR